MEKNDAIRQLRVKLNSHMVIQSRSQEYADGYNDACDFFDKILDEVESGEKPIPKDVVDGNITLVKDEENGKD